MAICDICENEIEGAVAYGYGGRSVNITTTDDRCVTYARTAVRAHPGCLEQESPVTG